MFISINVNHNTFFFLNKLSLTIYDPLMFVSDKIGGDM